MRSRRQRDVVLLPSSCYASERKKLPMGVGQAILTEWSDLFRTLHITGTRQRPTLASGMILPLGPLGVPLELRAV
jgi:hypothetical protein